MKKTYIKPEAKVYTLSTNNMILAGSDLEIEVEQDYYAGEKTEVD